MMNNIYLVAEGLGVVVILIVLYANLFELREKTEKRKYFTQLLILNMIVVIADGVSWLYIDWTQYSRLLWVLVLLTYVVPFGVLATFSRYIYVYISEKSETSKIPFIIMSCYSALIGIVTLVLCILGKAFEIRDGLYYPGPAEPLYYLCYIISLVFMICVVLGNSKKMGIHDTIGALLFCMMPVLSIILSILNIGMNLEEQKAELGYSNRISEWLEGFGRSGCVHPNDLEDYLAKTNIDYIRGYFKRRKTSLTILYRRKYGNEFKQVMMEIIPASDYSDDNQSMFLYVKNIDI